MTTKRRKGEARKYWVRRLNVLLRFAGLEPWKLNDGALKKLQGEMFFAVIGNLSAQERQLYRAVFDSDATREALGEAQRGLNRALKTLLVTPATMGPLAQLERVRFKIARQELRIGFVKGNFHFQYHTDHFPSQVYVAFRELLEASGVKLNDFLHCSYCNNLFLPLRKPRKGVPAYCSPKCASVIASRNYRARRTAKSTLARTK